MVNAVIFKCNKHEREIQEDFADLDSVVILELEIEYESLKRSILTADVQLQSMTIFLSQINSSDTLSRTVSQKEAKS